MNGLTYGAEILAIVFAMHREIHYRVSLLFYHLTSLHTKAKKIQSHTVALMWRKETPIDCVSLGLLKDSPTPLKVTV